MSHKTAQLIIGQVLTDEALRKRFLAGPRTFLEQLRDEGLQLTDVEVEALVETDTKLWSRAASRIDPRLQKVVAGS